MIVFHVCSITQLKRYEKSKCILPPVRAWKDIKSAERFSKQTGRAIILRLKFLNPIKLDGHKDEAVYQSEKYDFDFIVNRKKVK